MRKPWTQGHGIGVPSAHSSACLQAPRLSSPTAKSIPTPGCSREQGAPASLTASNALAEMAVHELLPHK